MPHSSTTELRLSIMSLARRVRAQRAEGEVTDGQRSVLFALHDEGSHSLGSLSERERVTPPSMNRTVGALVERGYVTRETSPEDARRISITLTDEGRAFVRETKRRRDAWFSTRLAKLTPEQRQILEQAAPILRELADS